jgi:5S rRNA maturation endonuclease (ribonuclease M5)
MMKIRGRMCNIDYEEELLQYDWDKMKIRGGKLLAASPFRFEKHPSFAVNLETGVFIDSGSDDVMRQGNFVKLLSWLRNETEYETEIFLLEKYYGLGFLDTDSLSLTFDTWKEEKVEKRVILDKILLNQFAYRHPYLEQVRGIEDIYQRAVHIGYDPKTKGISIPLFNKDGELVNIKFRSVSDKRFWYYGEGDNVKNHLWGLHLVNIKKSDRVFLVESEIDALTLWKHKYASCAVMGSSLTKQQRKLILENEHIKTIVIATDNDKAGKRLGNSIYNQLNGYVNIEQLNIPPQYKDVNDMPTDILLETVGQVEHKFLNW